MGARPNSLTDYLDLTLEAGAAIEREVESEERQKPGGAAENVSERGAEVIIAQLAMETARTDAEIVEAIAGVEWEQADRHGEPEIPNPHELAAWLPGSGEGAAERYRESAQKLETLFPLPPPVLGADGGSILAHARGPVPRELLSNVDRFPLGGRPPDPRRL